MKNVFDVLVLLARPAAGKSEVIRFLKELPAIERAERFHVGEILEIDDFPMLWTWFEEDVILERMGKPRLYTDEQGYFLYPYLWDLLVERIGLEYEKILKNNPNGLPSKTVLVEFSRGSQHGGFQRAFDHLSNQLIDQMAILYIDVSWEESLRKNRKRFNPDRPESILEHSVPDEKLKVMYEESDWHEITKADPQWINMLDQKVPYAVMTNEDDVTTRGGDALAGRLKSSLDSLWTLYQKGK